MKLFTTLGLGLLLASAITAQKAAPAGTVLPPGVEVLRLKWERGFNHAAESDEPGLTPIEGSGNQRAIANAQIQNPTMSPVLATVRSGGAVTPTNIPPDPTTASAKDTYAYSLKIRNTGAQTISAVYWSYIFLDPADETQVLGQHRFSTRKEIKQDKSATLEESSGIPPANLVNAARAGVKNPPPPVERLEIGCLLYADGTTWKNPSAPESNCETLRQLMPRKK